MTQLFAATALAFVRSKIGTSIKPQGMCLNFVWRAYGSHPSIGAAAGHLGSAAGAWSVAVKKHIGDRNVPKGFWAYLGPSPTRTDHNRNAGDAIISVGLGIFACTDASGSVVGYMTLAARERQTQRPYVGWAEDLGGHPIAATAGPSLASYGKPRPIPKPVTPPASTLEGNLTDMFAVQIIKDAKLRPGTLVKGTKFILDTREKTLTRVDNNGTVGPAKLATLRDEFNTYAFVQPGGKPIGWDGDTAWRYFDGGYQHFGW